MSSDCKEEVLAVDIARENTRQREGHSARTVAALIRSYWVNGGGAIQNELGVKPRVSALSELRRGAALSNNAFNPNPRRRQFAETKR